ncbi:D-alanyl-D-alanine carboxypeptidase [Candidatus Daviesbacteria bacterium]|nr:D-alanyl-D-alanine carboxypeptidase [Candidatus Daviesbacteria bacterium]
MKKFVFITTLVIIVISSAFSLFLFKEAPNNLTSPLIKAQKVLGVNLWLPSLSPENDAAAPKISAKAAFFIDTKSGQSLYSKNANHRLPLASLVKVMTALIALEYSGMDGKLTVSKYAADMEPDKMLLIAGEQLSVKELMYGIFLISANDAAEVLAEGTTGDRDEFIKLMNE